MNHILYKYLYTSEKKERDIYRSKIFDLGGRSKEANLVSLHTPHNKVKNKYESWLCKYEMKELPKDGTGEGIMKVSVQAL